MAWEQTLYNSLVICNTIILRGDQTTMNKKLARLIKQNNQSGGSRLPIADKLFSANRFGPLVFLLVFGLAGVAFVYSSSAAPSQKGGPGSSTGISMYITPSKQQLNRDSLIANVWVDSRNEPVNAVQAIINYPADKLIYVSSNSDSSQFTIQAETANTEGRLVIARGSTVPLTGDQLVATVVFKPTDSTGKAALNFDAASQLLSSNTNQNVLGQTVGGQYTLGK